MRTLVAVGQLPADSLKEKGKKVVVPEEIENLFSLMDFAHDGKISEEEFMRATGHYRRLGRLLTINTWQNIRKGRLQTFRIFS